MTNFRLPDLPYDHDALEPHMSRETLHYHHDKHHQTYVNTANDLLKESDLKGQDLEEVVKNAYGKHDALFNNAAQHFNHELFWKWMKPNGGGSIPSELEESLVDQFGTVDNFKKEFVDKGKGQFGSGWVWLAVGRNGLEVMKTPNGENPLVHGARPVLGCDVWEHSYYLDHRNDRGAYLETFLDKLVNWEFAAELLGEKVS